MDNITYLPTREELNFPINQISEIEDPLKKQEAMYAIAAQIIAHSDQLRSIYAANS